MSGAELEHLSDQWIEFTCTPEDSPEYMERFWVFEKMLDLIWYQPEDAWQLILAIYNKDQSWKVKAQLAAGPVEDLLAHHGAQFIDRVEAEAGKNPAFANLLGGVWQNSMSEDVWQRLCACRTFDGWNQDPETAK